VLPFWTETLGWSLVFANGFSLILMNLTGLYLERGVRRNWKGLLSFVLLTYLLIPYQAYAVLKGLFEPHEGGWHRTQKTGVITEVVERLGLRRHLRRLRPKKRKRSPALGGLVGASTVQRFSAAVSKLKKYIPRPLRRLSARISLRFRVAFGLALSLILLIIFSTRILLVSAAPDAFYLHTDDTTGISPSGEYMSITQGSTEDTLVFDSADDEAYWYTDLIYPTGGDDA
ncbi:unnamed protein product, partial [marine sediment metagenome]